MAKKPEDRYASAGDLALAAHEALSDPDQDHAANILRRSQEATLPGRASTTDHAATAIAPPPQRARPPPPPPRRRHRHRTTPPGSEFRRTGTTAGADPSAPGHPRAARSPRPSQPSSRPAVLPRAGGNWGGQPPGSLPPQPAGPTPWGLDSQPPAQTANATPGPSSPPSRSCSSSSSAAWRIWLIVAAQTGTAAARPDTGRASQLRCC